MVATASAPSLTTGRCSPAPTARMPACGGLMTAEKSLDAVHAEIGDRETAALIFLGHQLAVARAGGEDPSSLRKFARGPCCRHCAPPESPGRRRPPRPPKRRRCCIAASPPRSTTRWPPAPCASANAMARTDEIVDRNLVGVAARVEILAHARATRRFRTRRSNRNAAPFVWIRATAWRSPCACRNSPPRYTARWAAIGVGAISGACASATEAPERPRRRRQSPPRCRVLTMRPCGPLPLSEAEINASLLGHAPRQGTGEICVRRRATARCRGRVGSGRRRRRWGRRRVAGAGWRLGLVRRRCGGAAIGRRALVMPSIALGVLAFFARTTAIGVLIGDRFGALGDQDLAEHTFFDRLDFHGRFVGLNLGDYVAGLDRLAFGLKPFGERALSHGWRQGRHQHLDRHHAFPVEFVGRSAVIHARRPAGTIALRIGPRDCDLRPYVIGR